MRTVGLHSRGFEEKSKLRLLNEVLGIDIEKNINLYFTEEISSIKKRRELFILISKELIELPQELIEYENNIKKMISDLQELFSKNTDTELRYSKCE